MGTLTITVNGVATTVTVGTPIVFNLVTQTIANFAALPASPAGFYFVQADETKSGNPTLYYFNGGVRYWIAMTQDA